MQTLLFLLISCLTLCSELLFAQDEAPLPPPDNAFIQTLVMVGIAIAFFYFILWRPEQKRRKAMEAQRNALKKGDRVVAMGMIGTVSRMKEDTVIIKTGDAEVEFLKAAISEVHSGQEDIKKTL